ncbi:FAD binding domain-containing protein [Mollisia scopiformis]|uniref:FAD binding domain-containing protein n=1 Tax=Mollisia scopiformis TaxID=149040 RepID=A0A194WYY7_MOLSC|nr:FAD binding domain-containing protein [Mollisia scopiformis]KUJ13165.1 FAD binding domain-containing protein [Mollisia scopiformis]
MEFHLLSTTSVTTALLLLASIFVFIVRRPRTPQQALSTANKICPPSPEFIKLGEKLAAALPDSVIFPQDATSFKQSTDAYWAKQETEAVPACIVQPTDARQLSTVVGVLKTEYDERQKRKDRSYEEGLFAVRSGGHSSVSNAASIKGGVLIDLSLICEVAPSDDGSSVVIGTGAKWVDVSKVLDEKGLAVVGGRNSQVGVGGLTLGGGISFFSPLFGLVCSNVIQYEIVLASGEITTASASQNPTLWKALKGGSNNFGIVTRFTVRSFPSTKIWSGFLYMLPSQATKVLAAFHESVKRKTESNFITSYDYHASGPIVSFSYVQPLGFQVIAANLVYTKLPEKDNQWPVYWKTSAFAPLWRLWSTCKVRTLTSATDELCALNPAGRRQMFATTTIKNDPATIKAVHQAYLDPISSLRGCKGLVWTLIFQPLLPEWARKGHDNPIGLADGTNDPLVIVAFTINWDEDRDDDLVKKTTREAIEKMDKAAEANRTWHRFRYLNYCATWQRPFEGYGVENVRYLQEVSRKYDPDGLFQNGCVGGFKLDLE